MVQGKLRTLEDAGVGAVVMWGGVIVPDSQGTTPSIPYRSGYSRAPLETDAQATINNSFMIRSFNSWTEVFAERYDA